MAWIKIGDIGDNKNSSLVSDRSQVPLVSCSQYINQNWETKECYVYNDEWHLISSSFSGDTEAPIISIDPSTITLTIDEVDGYDFMTGVSANDNISSSNNINIRIVQNNVKNTPGSYSIIYGAQDEAGNMSIAVRIVIVENNNFSIVVNNVDGGTVDVANTAKSGSVVNFTASVQNTDWDTYSYQGMNIKSMSGEILHTLSSNQLAFEMPNQNIILEPIFNKTGTYIVKNGVVNSQTISNYSSSLQSKTYISHNTKNDTSRTTVSGNNKNNIGIIDVTGFSYVDAELSVSYSSTGNIWSYTGTSSVSLGSKTLYSHSSDVTSFTIPITNFDISSMSGKQTISLSTNLKYTCTNWWYDQNTTGTVTISLKNFYLHN